MPRPKKNNADYFPHYNGMRNHRKIKMLRNKFGAVLGYAFWCMMLEWLTEHDGLEWEFSDIEIEMLASELGVTDVEISNMISYSIKIELLFKNAENFIYSESLNENLSPVFEKRKTAKEISKTRQRRDNGSFLPKLLGVSVAETIVTVTEIPHSKVEYSKVKKSKVKVSKDTLVGLDKPTTTFECRCQNFIKRFNELRNSKFRCTDKVREKLKARLKDYSPVQIITALKNALVDEYHLKTNNIHLTPEYILREDILERFINAPSKQQKQNNNTFLQPAN